MAAPAKMPNALLALANCGKCSLCPKEADGIPPHPVFGAGSEHPKFIVVGEAPGATEVRLQRPFRGPSGHLLWKTLTHGKSTVQPSTVYATNAVLCLPQSGKSVTSTHIKACRERLLAELESVQGAKVILAVGTKAAEAIRGEPSRITDLNGRAEWNEAFNCWVVYAWHPAAVLRQPTLYSDFKHAVDKAREAYTWEPGAKPESDITWDVLRNGDEVRALLSSNERPAVAVCDIETTGLDPLLDRILEIGFAWTDHHAYILPSSVVSSALDTTRDFLEDSSVTWVYHHGKFDTNFLRAQYGIDARIGGDTMLLHHALDERAGGEEGGAHDLKTLSTKYVGAPHYAKDIDGKRMEAVPEAERHKYHAHDLVYTFRLWHELRRLLAKEPPSRVKGPMPLDTHDRFLVPLANALASVELRGIRIDVARWRSLKEELRVQIAESEARLREMTGEPKFNVGSWVQVLKQLHARGYKVAHTDEATIHDLQRANAAFRRPADPFLDEILECRSLRHTRDTYLIGLAERMLYRGGDDRIRTHLSMTGTGTGRLSSRDPNLQGIAKDSPIREMFVPSPGYTFVEADYAQLEVRVLAWYSRDPALIATLKEKDVHWATATRVWPRVTAQMLQANKDEDLRALERICSMHSAFLEFAQRQRSPARTSDPHELFDWLKTRIRRQAKFITFGIMYGEGAAALAEPERGLGVEVADAQQYIDNWKAGYPIATRWLNQQASYGKHERWVESANGRRRRFAYPAEMSFINNEAMNFPIQSFASDLNLAALIKLETELPSRDLGGVLLPIHDSLLSEVRTDRLDEGVQLIYTTMTSVLPDEEVFFDVDLKVGPNWAQLRKA